MDPLFNEDGEPATLQAGWIFWVEVNDEDGFTGQCGFIETMPDGEERPIYFGKGPKALPLYLYPTWLKAFTEILELVRVLAATHGLGFEEVKEYKETHRRGFRFKQRN